MAVFLSESDVQAAIKMPEALAAIEAGFRDYAQGRATLLPRISHLLPGGGGVFRILAATLPQKKMFGLKTLTGIPGKRLMNEIYFAILLFETGSGALRTVVSANYLTGLRTGAASGLAAKYLAREDASTLGVIGSGVQAWYQAEALAHVREIRSARVFSRDIRNAEALALRLRETFSIDALAVESAEEAVRGSSLVVAATTAASPVIEGAWLDPGTHVSSIGANSRTKRELDAACFARGRIVADSREQVLDECGDLRDAIAAGAVGPEAVSAELGELAAGLKPGRTSPDEITIFKSVGVALQDIAVAVSVFEASQRCGLGTEVGSDAAILHLGVSP
jgi:alanine dehydrogenase